MRWIATWCLLAGLLAAQGLKVGSTVGSRVTGVDVTGTTVILFVSAQCPVSNAYNDRMEQLYKDYSARGVQFRFVNANHNEKQDLIDRHRTDMGFSFPVERDEGNRLADRLSATVTPEAYVFDKTGVLRYHGHIDDAQNPARIRTRGLRDALDAVLDGGDVPAPETRAFGCTIKRVRKS